MGGPEKALATPLFVCIHALLVKLWSCYMMQHSTVNGNVNVEHDF